MTKKEFLEMTIGDLKRMLADQPDSLEVYVSADGDTYPADLEFTGTSEDDDGVPYFVIEAKTDL